MGEDIFFLSFFFETASKRRQTNIYNQFLSGQLLLALFSLQNKGLDLMFSKEFPILNIL